jgi:hypothetical protein
MFNTIVIMCKRCASVVRRVDIDALNLAGKFLFERFEGKEIVAKDETIVEDVVVGDSMRSVVRLLRIFRQNARLQLGPVLFANPGEFEFLLSAHVAKSDHRRFVHFFTHCGIFSRSS